MNREDGGQDAQIGRDRKLGGGRIGSIEEAGPRSKLKISRKMGWRGTKIKLGWAGRWVGEEGK
jgi:hypothetical protein